ncbi:MAG: DUF364 domain-containing protein [Actinomycetaceae bacterium]|nr:DUF364 domain-containing protein [Actinomycetaceae bacterium]
MASPWAIYDRLIDSIPADLTVTAAGTAAKWCRITSSESGAGMAFNMPVESRPPMRGRDLVGASLREVAGLAKSWNLAEAGMGMAALNSWHSLPERAASNGFTPCAQNNWAKSFDPYREATRGRKVAVVGHFPFAPAALAEAAELFILERNPVEGDYPDPAAEYLLPECDYVFITGSSFVNKTIPRLLELSKDAVTVMIGPSTPASPILLEYGADVVTAFACGLPALLDQGLAGRLPSGMYEAGMRVELAGPRVERSGPGVEPADRPVELSGPGVDLAGPGIQLAGPRA